MWKRAFLMRPVQRVRYQSNATHAKTFGDYMSEDTQRPSQSGGSKMAPSGYSYLTKDFPGELTELKTYLKGRYKDPKESDFKNGIDLKTFAKVQGLKSMARQRKPLKMAKQSRPVLFVKLLERNPKYIEYLIYDTFGIDMDSDKDSGKVKSSIIEEETKTDKTGSASTKSASTKSASTDLASTDLASTDTVRAVSSAPSGSFTDLLHSIKREDSFTTEKEHTEEPVLPKMTNFHADPTNVPLYHFEKMPEIDNEDKLEDFLETAKKESDMKKGTLFKAQQNYEMSKQRLEGTPSTLEQGTFFTPVLVPGTQIPYKWVVPGDYNLLGHGTGDKFIEVIGKRTLPAERPVPSGNDVYHTLSKNRRHDSATVEKLFADGWQLLDGSRHRLIFTRNTWRHYWQTLKWALAPFPFLLIALARLELGQ